MPNTREPFSKKEKDFLFAKAAATPWQVRRQKAIIYAGLTWLIMLVGILIIKLGYNATEVPLSTLLMQSPILPALIFLIVLFGYARSDITSSSYQKRYEEDHKP